MAKTWKKELDTLSEWIKSIRKILKYRIGRMLTKVSTIYPFVNRKPEVIWDWTGYRFNLCWFQLTKLVTILSLSVWLITTTFC